VTVDFSTFASRAIRADRFTNILQSIDQLGSASPFYNNLGFGNSRLGRRDAAFRNAGLTGRVTCAGAQLLEPVRDRPVRNLAA